MNFDKSNRPLRHTFLSALLLHAVVLICWVAYSFYQPLIFENFGFQNLTTTYMRIQNILLVVIPIVSGFITDRYFHNKEKTIIKIMVMVIITACLFLSLSGIFLTSAAKFISFIPILMLMWVVSMNMFYNPGLSVLVQNARQSGWSYASAITGSITDIVFALVGLLIVFFKYIGHVYTFGAGAVIVSIAAYYFYISHKNEKVINSSSQSFIDSTFTLNHFYLAPLVGLGLGFVHYRLLHHLTEHTYGVNGNVIIPVLMVVCAMLLLGIHNLLHKFGLVNVFVIGLILCCISYKIIIDSGSLTTTIIGLAILTPGILGLTGAAIGAALDKIPQSWNNFGTGLFLAGFNSMIYFII